MTDSIGCRIVVDGVVKAERITHEMSASTLLPAEGRISDEHVGNEHTTPPFLARSIYRFSVPIILAWLAIAVLVSIGVPSLEQVEKEHSVSLSPSDAPSFKAMTRMGEDFKESESGSVAMIVLEGQQPFGDDAHRFYDRLIRQLQDDPKHVRHIQNFWAIHSQGAPRKAPMVKPHMCK